MKKLSTLLTQREVLLRQARLANLAFAYQTLNAIAARIVQTQLSGRVTLKPMAPKEERYWPALLGDDINQSVVEEHFSDQNVMDLADVIAFITANDTAEISFRLEDIADTFLVPLRVELEREGVSIDQGGVLDQRTEAKD